MAKVYNIKNNKNYEKNRETLEAVLKDLEGKDISGFILSIETADNQAAFACSANPSILTFTQGYMHHLFLDHAYNHLDNAENLTPED
jgi:hypothetical protein